MSEESVSSPGKDTKRWYDTLVRFTRDAVDQTSRYPDVMSDLVSDLSMLTDYYDAEYDIDLGLLTYLNDYYTKYLGIRTNVYYQHPEIKNRETVISFDLPTVTTDFTTEKDKLFYSCFLIAFMMNFSQIKNATFTKFAVYNFYQRNYNVRLLTNLLMYNPIILKVGLQYRCLRPFMEALMEVKLGMMYIYEMTDFLVWSTIINQMEEFEVHRTIRSIMRTKEIRKKKK